MSRSSIALLLLSLLALACQVTLAQVEVYKKRNNYTLHINLRLFIRRHLQLR